MRLRHIPGAEEAVLESRFVIQDPGRYRGHFAELFGNNNPLEIEIGMGKGRFMTDMAARHPDINFIGIERYSSVLLRAIELREKGEGEGEKPLSNLYFICADAAGMADVFGPGEVSKIYLNFSDPWPKGRHAKRRLTSPQFLAVYDKILAPNGTIEMKTDNTGLFDYSLESIPASGWRILSFTRDLHHDIMSQSNVMTEYEQKFAEAGKPICKLIASRREGGNDGV